MKKASLLLLLICHTVFVANAAPKKPKLILAIVVDQFRADYLMRFRADYKEGFAKMLEKGAVFADAHLIASPTVTAIGHSTFLSGATPSLSGIAGNDWYDRGSKQQVTSVSDDDTQMLGGVAGRTGSSPHRMLVSTIGDELKMSGVPSKLIGVSIKDRSAILPGGHMADAAYWYDGDAQAWVSSSYYMKELPGWLKEINQQRPASRYLGQSWMPLDPTKKKPFCTMVAGSEEAPFCGAIEATPWGNDMIEEVAEKALVAEQLGQHAGTDILTVSFSSNDYVGHAVGPDAPQIHDISVLTDRLLGKFMDFVNKQVGEENVLVVLTADHGVAPVPEVNEARKMPGGRILDASLVRVAQAALVEQYGSGNWIEGTTTATLYLNHDLIKNRRLKLADVQETAAEALRAVPHAFRVYTGDALLTGRVPADFVTTAIRNGYNRKRSGDVIFVAEPFYIYAADGASHGAPFNYDTHIPIIFMGPQIKAGTYYERVAMNDIAPTLAAILSVQMPSGSVGRILSEILQ